MNSRRYLQSTLIGVCALLFTGAQFAPAHRNLGFLLRAPAALHGVAHAAELDSAVAARKSSAMAEMTRRAIGALSDVVGPLSAPDALTDAVRSYFAFRAAHPDAVRNPYLYFVDYGLPSTTPRGYVFDMKLLKLLDGPFTVAHGRGSAPARDSVPTRFSNAIGSAATSLGLYLAEATYRFRGNSGGRRYSSIGLRLVGVSDGFNDNAFARRVVAHGAPYVTPANAGRSEGCPAMEQSRARMLLPKLANGGMVFLYAPDSVWLTSDPWVTAGAE
jgi:L,D-transpeptidase-like protein